MKDFSGESRVEFVGLRGLEVEGVDKSRAMTRAAAMLEKLQKVTKKQSTLSIHVKVHEKDGNRKKWSIHSKLFFPGEFFEASYVEWDFLSALEHSLSVLEKEVKNKLKR